MRLSSLSIYDPISLSTEKSFVSNQQTTEINSKIEEQFRNQHKEQDLGDLTSALVSAYASFSTLKCEAEPNSYLIRLGAEKKKYSFLFLKQLCGSEKMQPNNTHTHIHYAKRCLGFGPMGYLVLQLFASETHQILFNCSMFARV